MLEKVIDAPEKYVENEDLYDHIYAVMLLGHFQEPKAHKVRVIPIPHIMNNHPVNLRGKKIKVRRKNGNKRRLLRRKTVVNLMELK